MKLSDYVAQFLADRGITHVFSIAGGASLHLIHSVAGNKHLANICPQHEQAAAMAADAYSRVTGRIGVAIATSGPGVTNLITGICCAYYDSVPALFITGNVSTFRMKGSLGVRQIGFQETDAVAMLRPITKYVALVQEPKSIRFELEKAYYLACSGRPGPVFIDIPDNVQRMEINPDELSSFTPDEAVLPPVPHSTITKCLEMIRAARRPIIIYGWGVRLAGAAAEARELVERTGIPMVPTWAAMDLLPWNHPQFVGTFGTHGTRYANFAVQNSDLILSVGSRLDTKATGSPAITFARDAKKIMVDIDATEIAKFKSFGLTIDLGIHANAKDFLVALNARLGELPASKPTQWAGQIADWKKRYPVCKPEYAGEVAINPYVFVRTLSQSAAEGDMFFVDTGCAIAWMMQAFEAKAGQRLIHDFNNTAMGYALPAGIGASLALGRKEIICVIGDGSMQMNIQELATVMHHKLPIKIFLINNHGYSMIQQTQDQWLGSRYVASSAEGGLATPDFVKIAQAYGFSTSTISLNQEASKKIQEALATPGAFFCNVEIGSHHRVLPQCKFGRPIEDAEPLLSREEFMSNMLVKPEPSSNASL